MIPRLNNHSVRVKHVKLENDETEVQSGLAVTPSQMLEMSQQGIPISPQNLGLGYEEGVSALDFEPPLQYKRGIDMNDLFEARENSKNKIKKAISDKSNFENQ